MANRSRVGDQLSARREPCWAATWWCRVTGDASPRITEDIAHPKGLPVLTCFLTWRPFWHRGLVFQQAQRLGNTMHLACIVRPQKMVDASPHRRRPRACPAVRCRKCHDCFVPHCLAFCGVHMCSWHISFLDRLVASCLTTT